MFRQSAARFSDNASVFVPLGGDRRTGIAYCVLHAKADLVGKLDGLHRSQQANLRLSVPKGQLLGAHHARRLADGGLIALLPHVLLIVM